MIGTTSITANGSVVSFPSESNSFQALKQRIENQLPKGNPTGNDWSLEDKDLEPVSQSDRQEYFKILEKARQNLKKTSIFD